MEATTFGMLGQYTNLIFGAGGMIAIFVLYCIFTYNSIIGTKNTTAEALSGIDTVLQNRYNLIPNLVQIVKQYMTHESSVLNKVSEMRASLMSGWDKWSTQRFTKENELQAGLKSIFAIAENYPDLKASTNFLELQTQWSEIEDRLQWARRAYNSAVKALSNKKEMFPWSIVASMITLPIYAMYETEEAAKIDKIDAKAMFNA